MKKKIYKIIEDNVFLQKIKTIQNKNDLLFFDIYGEIITKFCKAFLCFK